MIHDAARKAIGTVEFRGAFQGHCVLIARDQAATCAHLFGKQPDWPSEACRVIFPLLDFDCSATVIGWRPFDPSMARGTDIAVLKFVGDVQAPIDEWVRLDYERPQNGRDVVSLEFKTGLAEGDVRGATVREAKGSVISLSGDNFAFEGLSGTGLFYRDPGERLLGLVAAQPLHPGQSTAYAIPAREIGTLLWEIEPAPKQPKVTLSPTGAAQVPHTNPSAHGGDEASRQSIPGGTQPTLLEIDALRMMRDLALPSFGPNFRPIMEKVFQRALDVLDRAPELWTERDIHRLVKLDFQLRDGLSAEAAMEVPVPPALADALARLQTAFNAFAAATPGFGDQVPLDQAMRAHLKTAHGVVETLRSDAACGPHAQEALEELGDTLECADRFGKVRFGLLSADREAAVRAVGDPFRAGGRAIMAAIGRRADLAPPGTVFVDAVEAWCPELVVIPGCGGGFLMGSPEGQAGRQKEEFQHRVVIPRAFALARYPVMFDEYDAYCRESGAEPPSDQGWGRGRRPVINVSLEDAMGWCAWMSERTGAAYRLPSEAEWEYACRGDPSGQNGTPFCPEIARTGAGAFLTPEEANFDGSRTFNGSAKGVSRGQTVPVDEAGFRGNGFGLFQMHGNVSEWCEDVFEADYNLTPQDGSAYSRGEPSDGSPRVLRGGSWFFNPPILRSAYRFRSVPDFRNDIIGFRPARTLFTALVQGCPHGGISTHHSITDCLNHALQTE